MNMPVVRFKNLKDAPAIAWPCSYCWGKRIVMTAIRDELNRPVCPDCAGRALRTLSTPRFVLADIAEWETLQ